MQIELPIRALKLNTLQMKDKWITLRILLSEFDFE